MKKNVFPKRFVIACNHLLLWDWNQFIKEFSYYDNIHEFLYLIFLKNYYDGWHRAKKNVITINSETNSLHWYSGLNADKIKSYLKSKEKKNSISFQPYTRSRTTKYNFIALVKNSLNEMGLIYIGDQFLVPEVHFKVSSKHFAIAHLFAENYDVEPMPAPYVSGKILYKNFNLPKSFHEYHKKIHDNCPNYFSIGIDYKNRVLEFEKNQPMNIYHWADKQKFILRASDPILNF